MVRSAVYSFTLLCVAYGVCEACFWVVLPLATLFGGLAIFGLFCIVGAWGLVVRNTLGKGLANLVQVLLHVYKDGAPSTFHSWRYALGVASMLIVVFVVLPPLFHLHLIGSSWVDSFFGRLTAVILAIASLPNSIKELPEGKSG